MHHAYVIEGEIEQGIEHALMWIKEKLGLHTHMSPDGSGAGNPDVIILRHDFFSVDDAHSFVILSFKCNENVRIASSPEETRKC